MAKRRKPSDIYDHISPLDLKTTGTAKARRPRHAWVRDRRERMAMAQRSEKMRHATVKAWANGAYDGRDTNLDTQHGKSRAECAALWAIAEIRAKELIQKMVDDEILDLDDVVVPGSDEEKAKQALEELAKMALGPVDKRTKLEAIKTLLAFTKQKPAQKVDAKVSTVEEWLDSVAKDNGD